MSSKGSGDGAGPSPRQDRDPSDFPGWERELSVDYGDFLDAVMDPEDPLHEAARKAALQDPALRAWVKKQSP